MWILVRGRDTPQQSVSHSANILVSIVDSISACHAEDRGSIPRRGDILFSAGRASHLQKKKLSAPTSESWRLQQCVGRESNPGQLLGRQLCSPLYHQRSTLDRCLAAHQGLSRPRRGMTDLYLACFQYSKTHQVLKKTSSTQKDNRHRRRQHSSLFVVCTDLSHSLRT